MRRGSSGGERVAVGEAFDLVQKKQLVRLELGTLETAIGGVHYMEDQESNMSVIEVCVSVQRALSKERRTD